MNNNDIWWLQWWLPRWRVLLVFPYHKQATMTSLQCYLIRWGATSVAEAFLCSPNKLTAIIKIAMSQSGVIVKVSTWIVNLPLQILINLGYIQLSTINTPQNVIFHFPLKFLTLLYFIICRLTKRIRCNV